MNQRIADMAAWSRNHNIRPEPIKTQYDPKDILFSEPVMIARRLKQYILNQNVQVTPNDCMTGAITFDGSVPADLFHRTGHKHFQEFADVFYCKPQENLCTFEWQHSVAEFGRMVREGVDGFRARIAESRKVHKENEDALDFLDGCEIICDAIVEWGEKCARHCETLAMAETNPDRKNELLTMAKICRNVPAHPARTFREGVQSVYACFNYQPDSLGTVDRYLLDLYRQDIAAGAITRDKAKEYLQELFIMVDGHTPYNAGRNANYGGESHFAIGGYTLDGEDGYNELTELILEALMELPTYRPQISFRWTNKTPYEVLRHVLDCERKDVNKRICLISDEPRIKALMKNGGVSYEDAVNYSTCGCNEPALQGGIWYGGCMINIALSLTRTLYEFSSECCACEDFESFYALYEKELTKDIERCSWYADRFNKARARDTNVLSSMFLRGCIENAKSVTQGGCTLAVGGDGVMGLVCVIDSLTVIKQFVYDEKNVSMADLIQALKDNWKGHEFLRAHILKAAKFFGNDEDISNGMAGRISNSMCTIAHSNPGTFDSPVIFGTQAGYNPHYAWFGNRTPATPDGRFSGDAFMVGMGQTAGKDREGMTALLNSVAKGDPSGIFAGPYVCNMNVDPALIRDDEQFDKTVHMIEAYLKKGGLHLQLNYVMPEDLKRAKVHPDEYKSLRVRVSGFSANFVILPEDIQDDVIRRTLVR